LKVIKFIVDNFGSFRKIAAWGFNTGIYITIAGLFTSRFAIALGMIVMGSASLLNAFHFSRKDLLSSFSRNKLTFASSIFLLLSVVTSFIGSEETGFAMIRFRLYIGFLLIPLILMFSPQLKISHYKNYLLYALSSALIVSILIVLVYFNDYTAISKALDGGQPIPTPIPHIRFGMFMSLTFIGCLYALLNGFYSGASRKFLLMGIPILFFSIVFLSIRTAWLVTAIGTMSILLYDTIKTKNYKILVAASLVLLITAFGSYRLIPSVNTKVNYMVWDWNQFKSGNGQTYSDSERGYSLINGLDLWKQNFLLGVGSGDMDSSLAKNAIKLNLPISKIPHNQFLLTAVCGGMLSLIFLLLGMIAPLLNPSNRKSFPLLLMMLLYFITMIFEPTFETSIGVLSYVFLISLILKNIRHFALIRDK